MKNLIILLCLIVMSFGSDAQKDNKAKANTQNSTSGLNFWTPSPTLDQGRLNSVVYSSLGLYTASMFGLNQLWYADFDKAPFHSFDDSKSWQTMDKFGHMTSAYWTGRYGMDMLRWSGMDKKKSRYIGAGMGWIAMNSFEFFDGYSANWGFSFYDFAANTAGSAVLIGQDLAWGEQRITLKVSSKYSDFAQYSPKALGDTFTERLLKDYNGQTYWASINVHSFLADGNKVPNWLNFAVGVGAEGMVGSEDDNIVQGGVPDGLVLPADLKRFRQYYLSFDIDLHKLSKNFGPLKTLGEVFGFIKIPAPTLEFSDGGVKFHPLFF